MKLTDEKVIAQSQKVDSINNSINRQLGHCREKNLQLLAQLRKETEELEKMVKGRVNNG